MSFPSAAVAALGRPDSVVFAENQAHAQTLLHHRDTLVRSSHPSGTVWHPAMASPATGLRLVLLGTGHGIVYGSHGQRILYVDPDGTPLHECAWEAGAAGPPRLLRARVQLDWGQWVGIKPQGLVNEARFDLSKKPGWPRLTRGDLQAMAAQAMGVTPEEVAFFYDEESLTLDRGGQVTIRHRKDALYVLEGGGFEHARFMACMGAMHWGRIDFLPVVELFQSLLSGTGSAVFELIRGLYDDQNLLDAPPPLRYRGIPAYPSSQAFQLFSTYFQPETQEKEDPLSIFLNPGRSGRVFWRPRRESPRRYFDQPRRLCVTVMNGSVQKVTRCDDSAALRYSRPKKNGLTAGGRMVGTTKDTLQLQDGDQREELPLRPEWAVTQEAPLPVSSGIMSTWRSLFQESPPKLDAARAYMAVPLYPEDAEFVDEVSTQPLIMEQVLGYLERMAQMPAKHDRQPPPRRVLIDLWDAVIAECLECAPGAACTVIYARPEFAQRQAQRAWDHAVSAGRLQDLSRIAFHADDGYRAQAYAQAYDLIFGWIPFAQYCQKTDCARAIDAIAQALEPRGVAVLVGPLTVAGACEAATLKLIALEPVAETDGARMLRSILPKARIHPEATLVLARRAEAA